MDEEFLKRNTDCVYFLASPLTCKKGIECEFRHNEIARLNPRDCWYWLSGNCLNPACAFRHPPLDAGVPSEPTQSSLPANKTMVPCYFFFNGVCNKGDRCSFLHGPDDSIPAVKPAKNAFGSTDTLVPENKISSGNTTVVVSMPADSSFENGAKGPLNFKLQSKEDLKHPVPKNVKQRSASPQIPTFEYKEAATVTRLDTLFPAEGFVHSISHSSNEQSSGEQISNHVEPEERLESSPGFDVLVDVEPENLDYEDDSEYLPVLDGEGRELNRQYLGYEFKDPDEYDPMCTEAEILYEDERYDDYRFLDSEHTLANDRKLPSYSRDMFLGSILSRTRVHMQAEMTTCGRNMDLRDHLRRRRENNHRLVSGILRRHESRRLVIRNQERHRRHSIDQHRSRRLASELGLTTIASIREGENLSISDKHFFRNSQQHNRSRKHYREKLAKRQFHSSDVYRKQVPKERRLGHESTTFTGPKTLAQIKEEKKKYEENVRFKSSSGDFQDPKPLSEILKDKRRSDCVRDGSTCNKLNNKINDDATC